MPLCLTSAMETLSNILKGSIHSLSLNPERNLSLQSLRRKSPQKKSVLSKTFVLNNLNLVTFYHHMFRKTPDLHLIYCTLFQTNGWKKSIADIWLHICLKFLLFLKLLPIPHKKSPVVFPLHHR